MLVVLAASKDYKSPVHSLCCRGERGRALSRHNSSMESSAAQQRINVAEISSVVEERRRRKSRQQQLGALERWGKTMLLGIIGVALVSFFCRGGERGSWVKVFTSVINVCCALDGILKSVRQSALFVRKLRRLLRILYVPVNVG